MPCFFYVYGYRPFIDTGAIRTLTPPSTKPLQCTPGADWHSMRAACPSGGLSNHAMRDICCLIRSWPLARLCYEMYVLLVFTAFPLSLKPFGVIAMLRG